MTVSTVVNAATPRSIKVVSTTAATGEEFTYTLEPELAGASIPRVARLTKAATDGCRYFGNALFIVIGLLCFLARRDYDAWNTFIRHGVITQAVSYDKIETTGKGAATYILYRFQTDSGAHSFREKVIRVEYENMRSGRSMTVTYVPGTQGHLWKRGRISPDQRNSGVAVWTLPLLGAAIFGGAGIAAIASNNRNQLHLLREGVATPAVVRSGQVTTNSSNVSYAVQYFYWTGDKKREGEMMLPEARYRSMTEGNPYCTVLYDATNPSEHLPYFKIEEARLSTV